MKLRTKQVLAAAVAGCALFAFSRTSAAVPLSYTGGTYLEDFNSMSSLQSITTYPSPGPNDVPNATGGTLTGWSFGRFSGDSATIEFRVRDGDSTSLGHAGSHGTLNDPDRALGTVATTASVPVIGLQLINDTGGGLNQFTLTFTGEQWRRGTQTVPGALSFSFSTNASNILTGTFTPVPELNFTGPNQSDTTAVRLIGNDPGNRTENITFTVNDFLWKPGEIMTFRWNDSNENNADDWLAIDDLSFSATVFGELPEEIRWNTANLTGTWDQNADNKPWLDTASAPTNFTNLDIVTLGETTSDIDIIVDAAGVRSTSTTVSNSTNKYTLSGGSVGGTLNKTGAGTLVLKSANTWTGANIDAGTVETEASGALGALAINLRNGALWKTTTNAQTTVAANVVGITGTATIHTDTDLTLEGPFSGNGVTLIKDGPALLWARQNLNGLAGATRVIVNDGVLRSSDSTTATDGIGDGTVLEIREGGTFDESFGNGEQFAGLEGDGTYLGKRVTGTSGHINVLNNVATNTFVFNGKITAGVNGVVGNSIDERQILALRKNGAHTWVLTNPESDFSGKVEINAGVLVTPILNNRGETSPIGMGNIATFQAIAGGDIRLGASDGTTAGTLRYTGPTTTSDRQFEINDGGGILEIVEPDTVVTLSGIINGDSLTPWQKSGPGTLIITGGENAIPGLDINQGALYINNPTGNATGSGAVTVKAGTLLGGTGVMGGNVTVKADGVLAPGESIGTLGTSTTILESGAKLLWEVNSSDSTSDLLNISGSIDVTGTSTFDLTDLGSPSAKTFTLIKYTGSLFNFSNLALGTVPSPLFTYTLVDNQANLSVDLEVTAGGGPQWNLDANGSWNDANSWEPATVPTGSAGAAATANLLGKITAARTITLDGNQSVANLNIDNVNSYTIAPGNSGTLTIGSATTAGLINVANGSHTVSAPVLLAGSTNVDLAENSGMTLSGGIAIGAGKTVTKRGRGVLTISGPQNNAAGAALTVAQGTVRLNSNAGLAASAGSAATATVNLNVTGNATDDASLVVLGSSQDVASVNLQMSDAGPQTIDLNSSAAAGGFNALRVYGGDLDEAKNTLYAAIKNATTANGGIIDSGLHAGAGIGIGILPDAHGDSHVLIRATRTGDLNLDGSVTIADFIDLASNFNSFGTATWQEGDLNKDGNVTIADFINLAANFNSSYSGETMPISDADAAVLAAFASAHGVAVPEPTVLGMGVIAAAGLMARRRRK